MTFYDNVEYGHGNRPLFGHLLNNAQHGGFYAYYAVKSPYGYHHITMHDSEHNEVGHFHWNPKGGEIMDVKVAPEHQRKGLATAAHRLATTLAKEYNVAPPVHSKDRSDAGDAWAKSVGGPLPARVTVQHYIDKWGT